MKDTEEASMTGLAADLKVRIKGSVAVVGIGNILRADDGLGPKLIELLKSRNVNAKLFDCGTAPENYIFPILSTSCETVILVDAADIRSFPGDIRLFSLDQISSVSFSTHNPSPRLFTDLLMMGKENMNIFVISVQPGRTALGEPISKEVLDSLNHLADTISSVLSS